MKRVLITCIVLICIILTAGAQNICGIWKATESDQGATYYKFLPNNKAELLFVVPQSYADGMTGKIIVTYPGHYLIEGGKSLTVAFDKSQSSFDFKIVYTNNDIKARMQTAEGKEAVRKIKDMIYEGKDQIMQMANMVIPASYLYQIIYLNQHYMSVINAAIGTSQRYDMEYMGDTDTSI